MGWKTVIVGNECVASISLGRLKITAKDDYYLFPLVDIDTVIFSHQRVTITIPLLSELISNNINVIVCDERNDPIGIFQAFNSHSLVFKQLEKQIKWKTSIKQRLWKMIVEQKIQSEIDGLTLLKIGGKEIEILKDYKNMVLDDDATNKEGSSARVYFKAIFGESFVRDNDDLLNYALNYGYKILASFISKCIVSRGMITQLGIHHKGESNPFNLTYDFIESFRVIIDVWVYLNIKNEFNNNHKRELIEILKRKVFINNKWFRLCDAIEDVVDSYIGFLSGKNNELLFIDVSKGIRNED